MKILITNNWMQGVDDVVGQIEFADTAKANFLYEMLKMRPDSFRFEIGYIAHEDGKFELTEVSLVNKYPQYHPVILKRRFADIVRRSYRKVKRSYGKKS